MADSSYRVMEQALRAYARKPVYIATVEGKRTIQDVINDMREEGIVNTGVFLAPLMLVAGDHANNDMAGDDESFATILKANGYTPQCVIKGIGEYPAVRQVYLSHLQKAVKALENVSDTDNLPDKKSGILYGIGVGTGNPKQMTLQELEVIKSCDLIVIPAVSKEECYAYRIAEQACSEISTKPVLCMPFPMIKDEGKLEISHNKIYEAIEEYLYQGMMYVLKKYGYKIAILSGGFTYFGQYLQQKYGIDYVYANELEIVDGKLTGRYLGDVVDGKRKAELLRLIAQVEKVDIAQTIAVGDGANDLPMLGVAGLGIAFHAKPKVVANAKQSINTIGLDGVLYFLGFKDSYIDLPK